MTNHDLRESARSVRSCNVHKARLTETVMGSQHMAVSRRKAVSVVKTMVYLDEDVHNQLRHLAVDEKVSMSELVRQAVNELLKNRRLKRSDAMKGAGRIFRRKKKRPDGSVLEIPVWWIAYYYRGKEYRESSHSGERDHRQAAA